MSAPAPFRIGHGYDLHRLEPRHPQGGAANTAAPGMSNFGRPGRVLILGGVQFPSHPSGPISHSNGDVVLHAVTDAILGAVGEPDIGQLFPDNDPQHDGADSAAFLREAAARMRRAGWELVNMDITVICEQPKLSPHKPAMIANIAQAIGCEPERINLKGKTHEKVDAVGEGRAVEAHVVALVAKR